MHEGAHARLIEFGWAALGYALHGHSEEEWKSEVNGHLIGEFRATYAFMERTRILQRDLVFLAYSIANSRQGPASRLGMEQLGGGHRNVDGRFLVLYLVVGTPGRGATCR